MNRSGPHACRLILAGCLSLAGCAGYRMGARSLYAPDIQTVYVPMFESTSFRRNLGERLTEAVMKEIEQKTPYKVVGTPNADSVLTGTLVGDTKRVTVETRTDEPRQVEVNLAVQVTWEDRMGETLQQGTINIPPELTDVFQNAQLVPEVGRSVATTQQSAIQQLAEQIVGLMEAPW